MLLTTLERDRAYEQLAKANINTAGFSDRISVRISVRIVAALDTLPKLEEEPRFRPQASKDMTASSSPA